MLRSSSTLLVALSLCAATVSCSESSSETPLEDTDPIVDSSAISDGEPEAAADTTVLETAAETALEAEVEAAADSALEAEAAVDSALEAETIEPDSVVPTKTPSGASTIITGVTTDKGVAPDTTQLRALIGFPLRNEAALDLALEDMYTEAHPSFRAYMTADAFVAAYGPTDADVDKVKAWITAQGMTVARVSKNKLFLEVTGTVAQFNAAFVTTLHTLERENPQVGNPPIDVLGVLGDLTVPKFVADRIVGVLTADLAADTTALPGESGSVTTTPPSPIGNSFTPSDVATAYGFDGLKSKGFDGTGVKIGAIVGATFKKIDTQSFWKSFGITRADPTVVTVMEPIATRYVESTLDTEWSAGLAPGAAITVYQGPDSRNTSMLYTFNEAIARAEVSVLTDSFAHREDSEAKALSVAYDRAAKMATAIGITVMAASGDSAGVDLPSNSPHVTAVGGSVLTLTGGVATDTAWSNGGSGDSADFALPSWQTGFATGKRAVVDVAIGAGGKGYWVYYLGEWKRYGGTSFASPIFAAGVAVMNSYRASKSLPPIGWLNPLLYRTTEVQKAFRDVIAGGTASFSAGVGWDRPTGFGAPSFDAIAQKLP